MAENIIREKIEMFKEKVSGVRSRLPFVGERRILSDGDEEGEEGIFASFRSRVEERLGGIPALSEFFSKEEEEEEGDGDGAADGGGAAASHARRGGELSTGVSGGPELGIRVEERVAKTGTLIH